MRLSASDKDTRNNTISINEDCSHLSGEKEILSSDCNLVTAAPPNVNRPIPTPSIYKDERGEIHNLQVGKKRINVLFSKKGVMRSGDIHQNAQHDFIFSGRVEVWILTNNNDNVTNNNGSGDEDDANQASGGKLKTSSSPKNNVKTIYKAYDYIKIDPYVPHLFHFLEDTIMAEWWEPQGFYAWFYEPYRKLVQASFQPTEPGRFCLLEEKEDNNNTAKDCDCRRSKTTIMVTATTTLILGISIGYLVRGKTRHSR